MINFTSNVAYGVNNQYVNNQPKKTGRKILAAAGATGVVAGAVVYSRSANGKKAIEGLKNFIETKWNALKNAPFLKNTKSKVTNFFSTATKKVKDFTGNAWTKVKNASWIQNTKDTVTNFVSTASKKVKGFTSSAWTKVKNASWIQNAKTKITKVASDAWGLVKANPKTAAIAGGAALLAVVGGLIARNKNKE